MYEQFISNIFRPINKYKFTINKNIPISYKCIINFSIRLFIKCMSIRFIYKFNKSNEFNIFKNNKKYENKKRIKNRKKLRI